MIINVGILGATGYTGEQLLNLLISHPNVNIVWLTSQKFSGKRVQDVYPHLGNFIDLICNNISNLDQFIDADLVFSCLPNGSAMFTSQKFVNKNIKLIDLSPDFRLQDKNLYNRFYGFDHNCPELCDSFVYGLPELNKDNIKNASLIANAGCYATGVILGLKPVKNLINHIDRIIVDLKSPVSGSGRAPRLESHFVEMNQNIRIDSSGDNIQKYEIMQELEFLSKSEDLIFITSIAPVNRGILSVCYLKLDKNIELGEIIREYKNYYKNSPFIRIYERDVPEIKSVRGSNFCDIGFMKQDNVLIIVTAIDNLIKGASGQAIQNMNIMFGLNDMVGLENLPFFP